MQHRLTVSDVARELTRRTGSPVNPRDISDLFYQRVLGDDIGPIVGGRRLVARETLPVILDALRRRGKVAPCAVIDPGSGVPAGPASLGLAHLVGSVPAIQQPSDGPVSNP